MNIPYLFPQHERIIEEFEKKRKSVKYHRTSVEQLDLMLSALKYKIFTVRHDYQSAVQELNKVKDILNSDDDENLEKIQDIEKELLNLTQEHEKNIALLQDQHDDVCAESRKKLAQMDKKLSALKHFYMSVIIELETQKVGLDHEQRKILDKKISDINRIYKREIDELEKIKAKDWKEQTAEEKVAELLEERGFRITKSGNILTASGTYLKREEAECMGIFDGINLSLDNINFNVPTVPSASKEFVDDPSLSSLDASKRPVTSDDVNYLKGALGKALALGLAELVTKKPKDPIHYLGHWLFKYRYNQETDDQKKTDIAKLINTLETRDKEMKHKLLEEEARAIVLDFIIRAEEESMRKDMETEIRRMTVDAEPFKQ